MVAPLLTIREIMAASLSRSRRWHPGGPADWSVLEWAGAMCGEAGEAANVAKKLKRVEDQIANLSKHAFLGTAEDLAAEYRLAIARETCDAILYGVILCARVEVDLEAMLIDVFNVKSSEYGFPERIGKPDAS